MSIEKINEELKDQYGEYAPFVFIENSHQVPDGSWRFSVGFKMLQDEK